MKKEQKVISPRQFAFIIISFVIGSASLFVPESVAGRDAWISTIIGAIVGLFPLLTIIHLQQKFKGLTIIQYSELLLGKFFGKIMGILFIFNMFLISTLIVEDLALLFNIAIIPDTPEIIFRLGLIVLVAYAILSGIESIGRLAELYVFPIIFLLLILPFLTVEEVNYNLLRPILAEGYGPVIAGALLALTFPFGEIAMLGMIIPTVQDSKSSTKYYILAYLLASVLLLARTVIAIAVFSADVLVKLQLPIYNVFRLIDFGEFVNRIEAFFIFVWILGFFTKLLATFYGMVLGIGQIFNMQDKNSLVIPLGLLTIFLSQFMFPSSGFFVYFDSIILPFISIPLNIFFPLVLLILSFFYPHDN